MSGEANIDYRVKQASKYQKKSEHGVKQLSKINQKALNFIFASEQDMFEIEIIFHVPALISTIQFKIKQTNQISFDMYNQGQKMCNFQALLINQQIKILKTKFIKLQDKAQVFDKVIITFYNHDTPKQTQINYIFFKGFKQDTGKKVHKIKNVSQKDEFQPPQKKKVTQQNKKIFETRNKERTATPVKQLLEEVVTGKFKGEKQDQQLRKAMEQSKKEHQRQLNKKKQKKNQNNEVIQISPGPADQQQNCDQFFEYQVVQYQKIKNVFEHVTPQWIEAQRKAQYNLSVQSRHSLADKIKIKVFKQHNFCINNIVGQVKSQLVQIIKNLGGKLIEQPISKCILVTNKMQGGKVNLARTLTGVIIVKPNYIFDCQRMKMKIQDVQQYRP